MFGVKYIEKCAIMQAFLTTFTLIAVMLLTAGAGFLLVKAKAVNPDGISNFSKVLMFVCQPALTFYSFNKANYTPELGINLLIFFAIITAVQLLFLGIFYFAFRKKADDVRYRIASVATVLSNCSFLGVPLLEAVFPESPNVAAYSMMYFLSMNLLGWTLVSAMITRDRKYVSVKKILLNPATLSIVAALPFFLTGFKISAENGIFFGQLDNMLTILGKMTTPLCMLIMGMRLATVKIKALFTGWLQYFSVFFNQVVLPLFVYGVLYLLNVDKELMLCMYVMCACPVASVVQNYAEILGEGQDAAANTVLLGSIFSVATLPVLALLV